MVGTSCTETGSTPRISGSGSPTRGVSGPRAPRYNIAGAPLEQATHGGSGLAAPATTEYDTATSTSVAHRARMGGADDAVRPGGQERRGDRRLGHAPLPGRRRLSPRSGEDTAELPSQSKIVC